jgi:hypothetical protein
LVSKMLHFLTGTVRRETYDTGRDLCSELSGLCAENGQLLRRK